MIDIFNKICVVLSWFFLFLGVLGMLVFFVIYFMHEDTYIYFYFAIAAFVLGVILFTLYRRIAYLGMHRIIYSLDSVHDRVEEMNEQFRQRHSEESEETEE